MTPPASISMKRSVGSENFVPAGIGLGFRSSVCLPPAPEEPERPEDEDGQDRERSERSVQLHYLPSAAESPSQADQRAVPQRTSEDGVTQEAPAQGHTLETCRHRDQGTHAGDELADQDSLSPVTLEYPARSLQVRDEQEFGAFESLHHASRTCLPDPESEGVEDQGRRDPRRRRR